MVPAEPIPVHKPTGMSYSGTSGLDTDIQICMPNNKNPNADY
jgi:hypothetical protein